MTSGRSANAVALLVFPQTCLTVLFYIGFLCFKINAKHLHNNFYSLILFISLLPQVKPNKFLKVLKTSIFNSYSVLARNARSGVDMIDRFYAMPLSGLMNV
jgi:hypothetical protein